VFVTAQGHPGAIFWRAISRGNVLAADAAAWELAQSHPLPLDFAMALVRLYGETGDRRYDSAALRYLARYIAEETPSLADLAAVAALLAERPAQRR
jgi:hypothetical protein